MQLYALNNLHELVNANHAYKQQNYFCTECLGNIRLRGGIHRQNHFYHVNPNNHCRLNGKGMTHLQIQFYLLNLLTTHDCQIEYRFAEINRIADVAWFKHKIIFEIQCSSITADEIQARNRDYTSLGWMVVWILHDNRFNQKRYSAAEWLLDNHPHYFTNMNDLGHGIIYDQFSLLLGGLRLFKSNAMHIDLDQIKFLNNDNPQMANESGMNLKVIKNRLKNWPVFFNGDLLDLFYKENTHAIFKKIADYESEHNFTNHVSFWQLCKMAYKRYFIKPYLIIFRMLLERACK